jgi:hypothetical protein
MTSTITTAPTSQMIPFMGCPFLSSHVALYRRRWLYNIQPSRWLRPSEYTQPTVAHRSAAQMVSEIVALGF